MPVNRLPLATYRFQFGPGFRFADARRVAGYLTELGASDLYASPLFQARPGSSHGYDVLDPTRLNPELGTEEEFAALVRETRERKLGWLQDIVPNHMAWSGDNPMMADLLELGPLSAHYQDFDILWDPPAAWLKGKVLAPFLGRELRDCLKRREIRVEYGEPGFAWRYFESRFPLALASYRSVLPTVTSMRRLLPAGHPELERYRGVQARLQRLNACAELSPAADSASPCAEDARFVKEELWRLYEGSPAFRRRMDEAVRRANLNPGREGSALERLLARQVALPAWWRVSLETINYRRFFTINEMIGVRVERPEVFAHTHSLIFRLLREGVFTGLRVDHIDGLYDPQEYLSRLRGQSTAAARGRQVYIVVEKILDLREELAEDWPVQGTTGYEFDNYLNGIFCRPASEAAFDQIYLDYAGIEEPFSRTLYRNKKGIAERWLAGDFDNLAWLARRALKEVEEGAGIPQAALRAALVEFASLFPVYRSYVSPRRYSPADRAMIQDTLERARLRNPDLERALQALKGLLLPALENPEGGIREEGLQVLMRIQQITGPLMAKGFEDTTLYQYNRLLSLNAVGGNPTAFGIPLEAFHGFNERKMRSRPHSMNATSTHDTKRGEDVRARINVLTEIPGEWASFLVELRRSRGVPTAQPVATQARAAEAAALAAPADVAGGAGSQAAPAGVADRRESPPLSAPDPNDEYLLYQTLLGAFPADGRLDERFIGRIQQYLIKATREAKRNTSWIEPNIAYEEGFLRFLERILGRPKGAGRPASGAEEGRRGDGTDGEPASPSTPFLRIFLPFQRKVAFYGIFNSLSQLLVKLTAPGVPDIYQGTEFWDLSLVDPDNRAPVDFAAREAALREIRRSWEADPGRLLRELLDSRQDGRIKMFLLHRGLLARRGNPGLFLHGEYLPLGVQGTHAERVVAFARRRRDDWAVTAVPRFLTGLVGEGADPLGEQVWGDTRIDLPEGSPARWENVLTSERVSAVKLPARGGQPGGSRLPAAAAFRLFPACLLVGKAA